MTNVQNTYAWLTDLAYTAGVWSIELSYSMLIVIVVAIAQAILILRLYHKTSDLRSELDETRKGFSAADANNFGSVCSKALTGSLGRFSIGEVIQFLNSLGETGIVDVLDTNMLDVHRLMMQDGEIVDAFSGALCGEPAIRTVLGCNEGTFTFIRGDLPTIQRAIKVPTMSLLMDAYKEADEARELVSAV